MVKGEPWFVGKDVCEALDFSQYRDAVARLDEEDKRVSVLVDTPGGKQEMTAINESGLYCLIFQSRKPAAKKFKRWVTCEVLPSLRKYGRYVLAGSVAESREEIKLEKRERMEMLGEIGYHLTETDKNMISRKLYVDRWKVSDVLSGRCEDVTILIECIERATKNANAKRKLRNGEVRKQIIAILRGVNVGPLVLE
jgi:prophage antirepressor-like protein